MSNITIIGRVGTDPTMEKSPTGKDIAKFRLAESGWDPVAREETTTWWDVSAWEKQALAVQQNVRKGERIYVTGTASVWKADSGDRDQINAREVGAADRYRYEVDPDEAW